MRVVFVGAAMLISGCAPASALTGRAATNVIVYETASMGPFCGACDSLKLTASEDGRVLVERGRFAEPGRRWRVTKTWARLTPDQFALFRSRLAEFRPTGSLVLDGPPNCRTWVSDSPEIRVIWREQGRADELTFSFGCDVATRSVMRETLRALPAELGFSSPLAAQ